MASRSKKPGILKAPPSASKHLLECPICLEDLDSPIYQCRQGHILCVACRPKFKQCPSCKENMSKDLIRNRALEDIVNSNKTLAPRDRFLPQPPSTIKNGKGEGDSCGEAKGSISKNVDVKRYIHTNIYCNNHQTFEGTDVIVGPRYRCLQCPDFDLCEDCKKKGIHDHHVFIRITGPSQRPLADRLFKRCREEFDC